MTLTRSPAPWWPVALGLLAITVSLALQIWFPRLDSSEINDTWNVDFGGRNAIYQFAQRRWSQVSRNILPLTHGSTSLPPEGTLCLLGPARPPTTSEWNEILDWVSQGGRLLFAPQWKNPTTDIPALGLSISSVDSTAAATGTALSKPQANAGPPPNPVPDVLPRNSPPPVPAAPAGPEADTPEPPASNEGLLSLSGVSWQSNGKISGPGTVLLRSAEGVQGVELRHGHGSIIVLASDHIFSNRSLDSREAPRSGVLAARLLQRVAPSDSTLVFDESLNATGQPQVVGVLLNYWLRPVTLQAVTMLLIFGWAGSQRFGNPLPPRKPPRHSLVEHTDALGNLYWHSGNGRVPLQAYLERLLAELRLGREAERLPRRLDHLAAATGLKPQEIESRIRLAREAVARRAVRSQDAARLIRLLSELRPVKVDRVDAPPPQIGSVATS